jgi:hypothetical protein
MGTRVPRKTLLALAATLGLLAVEQRFMTRPGHILGPTSEELMQTASVADLRSQPWLTLWYLHIQPPAFDALRAALVHTVGRGATYEELVVAVDIWLLRLWALAYGATIALIALWVGELCGRPAVGLAAAVVWALQPPALLYPTLLDSTILGALGLLWCSYEIWRGRALGAGLAVAALFLTRSHFQWPFALVVGVVLGLRGSRWRDLVRYAAVVALVMVPLYVKQWAVFGLPVTSSFFGDSACKSLGIGGPPLSQPQIVAVPGAARARTLTRRYKPSRDRNYNQLEWLWESRARGEDYRAALRTMSPGQLLEAYATNAAIFFEPTSSFARSPITRLLPWRPVYDVLFSGWPYLLLCAVCAIVWLTQGPWRTRLARAALALPVLYVVAISILFERKEGMRYRHFVEPVSYVFVVASACAALGRLRARNPSAPQPSDEEAARSGLSG